MSCKYNEHDIINTDYLTDLEDGFLRMRVSHKCNCHCEFCYQNYWKKEDQEAEMPKEWLYDLCTPLYGRVKTILMGGGEITFAKEGYNFCKFVAEKYPQTNIITESNGLLYNEKWQDLAIENLFMQHFSLNASNPKSFEENVWKEGGQTAYNKILNNIKTLSQKWQDADMTCFTPSISMVINHKNTDNIYDFIKLALQLKLKTTWFYFDHREGSSQGEKGFLYPEILEPALKQLMEIERVLTKKFNIYFKLWLPLNCTQRLQAEVDTIPIETLKNKYKELLDLAKDRDIKKEWEKRNKLRSSRGKKQLTIKEDYFVSLHDCDLLLANGKKINTCMAPKNSLDIWANGSINLCGWVKHKMASLQDYIFDGKVNWANILNLPIYQDMRKKVYDKDFSYCMDCCPLHPANPHLNDVFKNKL